MLRCCSSPVNTDGVNGHVYLLSALPDLFTCVISFIFSVCSNTTRNSSDTLKKDNAEPENIERWETDYQRHEIALMQGGMRTIHLRKNKFKGMWYRSLKSRRVKKKGEPLSPTIWLSNNEAKDFGKKQRRIKLWKLLLWDLQQRIK